MPRLSREGRPQLGARDAIDTDDDGQPGGLDLKVMADLSLNLGRVADEMERERKRRERFATALHIIEVNSLSISAASQTLDKGDIMGPRTGKVWDVTWMSCATFTAGTIAVYKDGAVDSNKRFVFTQAGVWEPSQFLLQRGQRMILVSDSNFAGTAQISFAAVEFDEWLLPDYLL